ncbi:hypothetical protein ABPG75_010300 [Micractinium tetrahymenae]
MTLPFAVKNALGFAVGTVLGTIAYFTVHPEEMHMLGGDSLQVRWRASQWDAAQVAQVQQAAAAQAARRERWSNPGQSV